MPARRMRWRSRQPSLEKILTLDPQHIIARMARMMQSLEQGHLHEARNDLDLVLNHPKLIAELRKNPQVFPFLHLAAQRFARYGHITEALRIADMAVACSLVLKQTQTQGRSHFYKAEVLSVAARADSRQVALAAKQLQLAIHANPKFKVWYQRDKLFDPVRTRINAALDQLPEISRKKDSRMARGVIVDRWQMTAGGWRHLASLGR